MMSYGLCLLAMLLCSCVYSPKLSPKTTIRVVDDENRPIPQIHVDRSWEHYGMELRGEDDGISDKNGLVVFPRRGGIIQNPLVLIVQALAPISVHASTGKTTIVNIYCPDGWEVNFSNSEYTLIRSSDTWTDYESRTGQRITVDHRRSLQMSDLA